MPKTAYPTATDLAQYLAATGFLTAVTVTAGTGGVTQTVMASAEFRVGDQVYFAGAQALRIVSAIPSSTTLTVTATVTTTTGEDAFRVPAALDLTTLAQAGIDALESALGRKILATADQTRNFTPPNGWNGVLDLKADLASITSVTLANVAQILYTDYRPLPEDADEEGKPWNRIQFKGRWWTSYSWGDLRAVTVTGRWGYYSAAVGMSEELWTAMLAQAFLIRLPQLTGQRTGGLVRWTEADVTEDYGNMPLDGLRAMWQAQVDSIVNRYRRVTVG